MTKGSQRTSALSTDSRACAGERPTDSRLGPGAAERSAMNRRATLIEGQKRGLSALAWPAVHGSKIH